MILVAALAGVVTVQDGGRPGRMHEGVPPGGALVPELLARANAAVRNAAGEAALEIVGAVTLRAEERPELVASDAGDARTLAPGETCTVECGPARVRYAAVRGGLDVPLVLGGRGTLLAASLGGLEGRALRRGDRMASRGEPPCEPVEPPAPPAPEARVLVLAGPDLDRFAPGALEVLVSSLFVVDARSDRAGVRLVGPPLPRIGPDTGVSAPMVRGAIQVPAAGPIVLGPDHPTTGGYPVLATVCRSSLGALFSRPPGSAIRFALRDA
jgi:allophanate hydrolase subunit 2